MARPKPDPRKVLPQILDAARELITQAGFDRLTMKAVAERCGMSVGKLYHFVPSKDALFLQLEIEYFDQLNQRLSTRRRSLQERGVSPREAFPVLLEDYCQFATGNMSMYLLVTRPPKVFDHYLGTRVEALATQELKAALRALSGFRDAFLAARQNQPSEYDQEDFLLLIHSVHGLILMSQSPVWPYVKQNPDDWSLEGTRQTSSGTSLSAALSHLLKRLLDALN